MSAIRQNSSSSSPHVAFAEIFAFIATLKGFGNKPPFGDVSIKRWNGCAPSESCLKSAIKSWNFSNQKNNFLHNLINELIYKIKWSTFSLLPLELGKTYFFVGGKIFRRFFVSRLTITMHKKFAQEFFCRSQQETYVREKHEGCV